VGFPVWLAKNPLEVIEKSAESSRTTHGAATCVDACRYFGALIAGAVNGVAKDVLLSERYCPISGYWAANPLVAEIDEIAAGSFKLRQPPEIKGTGEFGQRRGYHWRGLRTVGWGFLRRIWYTVQMAIAIGLSHFNCIFRRTTLDFISIDLNIYPSFPLHDNSVIGHG
jgi:hypothetical protein